MRILHVTQFYALVGGLERYLHDFCAVLERAGHTSSVVFGERRGGEPIAERRSYQIPGVADVAPAPDTLRALEKVLAEETPDVVMIHEIPGAHVVDLLTSRCATVRYAHGVKLVCPGRTRAWPDDRSCPRPMGYACQVMSYRHRCMPRNPAVGLPLIRRTLRIATLHGTRSETVVPSRYVRDLLVENGFPVGSVHVAPYFTRLPIRPLETPDGAAVFTAARLVPGKGVHLLLQAAARVPGVRLTVAGDGPERRNLERLGASLGLTGRLSFGGWLDADGIARELDRAAVVVMPSIWPETFGIIGIEAMAHARPVVAFDVGGVREWLRPAETGLLAPAGDVAALSDALRTIVSDAALRDRMGRAARSTVEGRFTGEAHLAAFLPIFETARRRPRPSPASGAARTVR